MLGDVWTTVSFADGPLRGRTAKVKLDTLTPDA